MNYPKNRYTGEKPWMNKEWLYNEYVTLDKSTQQIADEHGCKRNTIQCWLMKHSIKKDNVKREKRIYKKHEDYNYLYQSHIVEGKTVKEIAEETGMSYDAIIHHLKRHNIPINTRHPKTFTEKDKDEMIYMYCEERISTNQIARYFNTSHNVIVEYLKNRNIKIRNISQSQFTAIEKEYPEKLKDRDFLYNLYWEQNKSTKEIAEILNVNPSTINRQLSKFNIPKKRQCNRDNSSDKVIKKKRINELVSLVRKYCSRYQNTKAMQRDNYVCQICGKSHTSLQVHHMITLNMIVNKICEEHIDINILEDDGINKMYDIIINDKRFLNMDNLITLCRNCHIYQVHGRKIKK